MADALFEQWTNEHITWNNHRGNIRVESLARQFLPDGVQVEHISVQPDGQTLVCVYPIHSDLYSGIVCGVSVMAI